MNFFKNWKEEKRSVFLYRIMAAKEKGTPREALFSSLAEEAEKQAEIWEKKWLGSGETGFVYCPDSRTRIVATLLRWIGPRHLKMMLAAMKVRGISVYSAPSMTSHPTPMSVQEVGRRHRGFGAGGNLRAAVFGVNDGLVSNVSLILGVAGASGDAKAVLLAGIAGLLAGAFSMAAGEFVSVRSQREMFEYQIGLEREELEEYPEQEAEELALIYKAKGLTATEAKEVADKLISDPARALDTLAREELGLNPDELGSPWGATLFSFFSFAAGAFVPLLPFLITDGPITLPISVGSAGVVLFLVGTVLSLFTGRNAVLGGVRMLLIGSSAGGVTFLIGRLIGVALN